MLAKKKYLIALPLLVCLAALINTTLFGTQSFMAYFGFTVFAAFAAIYFGSMFFFGKVAVQVTRFPIHIIIFFVFALYVLGHGIFTGSLNLTHYYWACCTVFIIGFFCWQSLWPNKAVITKYLFDGILILAFIESVVVILQYVHVIASKNQLFVCTGSWVNPNVTALFLAMAVFAVLRPGSVRFLPSDPDYNATKPDYKRTFVSYASLTIILLAILLLQCRTAYIVALIFIVGQYSDTIMFFVKEKLGINRKVFIAITFILSLVFICFVAFRFKSASTNGRLQIWKNCLGLAAEKPILGHGFGMFEKTYNLYIASNHLPSNGHVNMPYNDFLELGVEGGMVAILLWCAFLFTVLRFSIKNNQSLLPVMAFCFVQLVNFGFQAIPAFALFLVYEGLAPRLCEERSNLLGAVGLNMFTQVASPRRLPRSRTLAMTPQRIGLLIFSSLILLLPLVSLVLFINQITLAHAFYKKNEIAKTETPYNTIESYSILDKTLHNYSSFHETYGDAYLKTKQYGLAIKQFTAALRTSSNPETFNKCGFCYQQQNMLDSSEYYYSMVENMEPYKYAPRMALLKLYQLKGDSATVQKKAHEIMAMPIKVESEKVDKIRAYAMNLINKTKYFN